MTLPESLYTVEYAQTMLDAASARYRDAIFDCTKYSLLITALRIRQVFPSATHLWIEPSDQGPHMTVLYVDGPDDYETEEGDELTEGLLWDAVSNLDDAHPSALWSAFVANIPGDRGYRMALDLDLILFYSGDYRGMLPKEETA